MKINFFKKIVLLVIVYTLVINTIYATNINQNTEYSTNEIENNLTIATESSIQNNKQADVIISKGLNQIKEPINEPQKKIASVIGDSFAGMLLQDEGSELYNFNIFPVGGIDRDVNQIIIEDAIKNDTTGNILLLTGVNDAVLTNIEVFDKYINRLIQSATKRLKHVYFHSYMKVFSLGKDTRNTVHEPYDEVLRKYASSNSNVTYIDMSNMNTELYVLKDGKHYDKMFYRTLKSKLQNEIYKNTPNKTTDIWDIITRYDSMTVIGDSSAEIFCNLEDNKLLHLIKYVNILHTTPENRNMINSAIDSKSKYVLLSLGETDYAYQTKPELFELEIRNSANLCMNNRKQLILHTYMMSPITLKKDYKYSTTDYDKILRKIAEEYENVEYIDMTEDKKIYKTTDGLHYNKEFYDDLYDKIIEYTNKIIVNND